MTPLTTLPPKHKAIVLAGMAGLIALIGFAIFGSRGVVDLWGMQQKQVALESLAFRLQQDNERLRTHIDRLEHDDAYLQKVVRERLGWIQPGEVVYRVRRPVAPSVADAVAREHASDAPAAGQR
jgi:cell division protein FtsB